MGYIADIQYSIIEQDNILRRFLKDEINMYYGHSFLLLETYGMLGIGREIGYRVGEFIVYKERNSSVFFIKVNNPNTQEHEIIDTNIGKTELNIPIARITKETSADNEDYLILELMSGNREHIALVGALMDMFNTHLPLTVPEYRLFLRRHLKDREEIIANCLDLYILAKYYSDVVSLDDILLMNATEIKHLISEPFKRWEKGTIITTLSDEAFRKIPLRNIVTNKKALMGYIEPELDECITYEELIYNRNNKEELILIQEEMMYQDLFMALINVRIKTFSHSIIPKLLAYLQRENKTEIEAKNINISKKDNTMDIYFEEGKFKLEIKVEHQEGVLERLYIRLANLETLKSVSMQVLKREDNVYNTTKNKMNLFEQVKLSRLLTLLAGEVLENTVTTDSSIDSEDARIMYSEKVQDKIVNKKVDKINLSWNEEKSKSELKEDKSGIIKIGGENSPNKKPEKTSIIKYNIRTTKIIKNYLM